MRCQTIRSVFRGLLTVGLLASPPSGLLHASWKDRMPPVLGSCFIHDLHWDDSRPVSMKSKPIQSAVEIAASEEHQQCLAASEQFEFRQKIQAVAAALQKLPKQFSLTGARLFLVGLKSRNLIVSSIQQTPLQLVQWIRIPDALPVTTLASEEHFDFDEEWNCGDWSSKSPTEVAVRLPQRKGGNVFVYAIETNVDQHASIACTDSQLESDALCNPLPEPLAPNAWQVGIDPAVTELDKGNSMLSWRDSVMLPSVCCPIDCDQEACSIGTLIVTTSLESCPSSTKSSASFQETSIQDHQRSVELDSKKQVTEPELTVDHRLLSTQLTEEVFTSPYASEEEYERTSHLVADEATGWGDSTGVCNWIGQFSKKFSLSQFAPSGTEPSRPTGTFSLEDIFSIPETGPQDSEAERNTIGNVSDWVDEPSIASIPADESIPSTIADCPAQVEVAEASPKARTEHPQSSQVSKYLATRIRTLGTLLLDFATQLDQHSEQIEIARGQELPQR
jgi:hypothetical protein